MVVKILKSVLRAHGEQPGGPSDFLFFIASTEVDAYMEMKYFLDTGETFMKIGEYFLRHLFTTPISITIHLQFHKIQ